MSQVKETPAFTYGYRSDIGNRANNQDSIAIRYQPQGIPGVFIVADGMGAYEHSEYASQLASKYCADNLINDIAVDDSQRSVQMKILETIYKVNNIIYNKSQSSPAYSGIGTTLTIFLLLEGRAYIANVGDSRCYLIRNNILVPLSVDHTLAQKMVDAQMINKDQALNHPNKNILTRAVGSTESVHPDIVELTYEPHDRILLSSDGLHGYVQEDLIENAFTVGGDAQEVADALVNLALATGGNDNVSVLTVFLR